MSALAGDVFGWGLVVGGIVGAVVGYLLAETWNEKAHRILWQRYNAALLELDRLNFQRICLSSELARRRKKFEGES